MFDSKERGEDLVLLKEMLKFAKTYGAEAFHELRTMKYYNKSLDLCVLTPQKQPVAMAIVWYKEGMPYCELEPLAVVWWERRKGIATAILNEATNRITHMYPQCKGMKGGDQAFYTNIGYEKRSESTAYHWEKEVFISWEPESINQYYRREVE